MYGSESTDSSRDRRYATEASKEELIQVENIDHPSTVEAGSAALIEVTVKNTATVILPGDPDRCEDDGGAFDTGKVGYRVGVGLLVDGSRVLTATNRTTCIPAVNGTRRFVIESPPLAAGRHSLDIDVQVPGSGRLVGTDEFVIRATAPSDDSDGSDDSTDDSTDDSGGSSDDGNTDDSSDDSTDDDDSEEPPEGQSVGEWWGSLSSQEKLMFGGLGAAGVVLFTQGSRGR